MDIKKLTTDLSVSPQIVASDMQSLKGAGFRAIICNRPDGEGADQPTFEEIANAAKKAGLEAAHIPIIAGKVTDEDAEAFNTALTKLPGPVLAYCRTGTRSATLWSLGQASKRSLADILVVTKAAGYDMAGVIRRIVNGGKTPTDIGDANYEVVIVGAGAGGIAAAASLKSRKPGLE
ncbi:MAG: sulfide:quinone oxidoreductase, partial [Yoonia sp.]